MSTDQKQKYYFISVGQVGEDVYKIEKYNVVTDVHPMVWLKGMIDTLEGSGVRTRIDFYAEIEEEHYFMLKDSRYNEQLK